MTLQECTCGRVFVPTTGLGAELCGFCLAWSYLTKDLEDVIIGVEVENDQTDPVR